MCKPKPCSSRMINDDVMDIIVRNFFTIGLIGVLVSIAVCVSSVQFIRGIISVSFWDDIPNPSIK